MKPNSKTVPTNVTLISSVRLLGAGLTLIRSRIWAAHFAVKCALTGGHGAQHHAV